MHARIYEDLRKHGQLFVALDPGVLVAFQHRQADVVFDGYDAAQNDTHRRDELRRDMPHADGQADAIKESADDTGQGVDVLPENQRHLVDKNVADDTAHGPRHHPHDNGHPHRESGVERLLDADHGEQPQPDGVEYEERVVQPDDIPPEA